MFSVPHAVEDANRVDTGLACLVTLCRLLGVPVEGDELRHRAGAGDTAFDMAELLRAARRLEFKARIVSTSWARLDRTPLPAIAETRDGRFFILAKVGSDRALVQDPLEQRPVTVPRAQLEAMWNGRLLLLARRAAAGGAEAIQP